MPSLRKRARSIHPDTRRRRPAQWADAWYCSLLASAGLQNHLQQEDSATIDTFRPFTFLLRGRYSMAWLWCGWPCPLASRASSSVRVQRKSESQSYHSCEYRSKEGVKPSSGRHSGYSRRISSMGYVITFLPRCCRLLVSITCGSSFSKSMTFKAVLSCGGVSQIRER